MARKPDVKIAVMGPSGTGKSSLIYLLTGDKSIKIGNRVEYETSDISLSNYIEPDGSCVTFADIPGFDDSREGVTDVIILQRIAAYLETEYEGKEPTLNGIIYLHPITAPKIGETTVRNLRRLCGSASLKNVLIVTTRWDEIDENEGSQRERELMTNPKFFKLLVDKYARFLRHDGTVESARNIMLHLLANDPIPLKIQEELASGTKLQCTEAGSELTAEMSELMEAHRGELEVLRNELKDAVADDDDELKKELEEEKYKIKQAMKKWSRDKDAFEDGLDLVRSSAWSRKEAATRQLEEIRLSFLGNHSHSLHVATSSQNISEAKSAKGMEQLPLTQGTTESHGRLEQLYHKLGRAVGDKDDNGRRVGELIHDMESLSLHQETFENTKQARDRLEKVLADVKQAAVEKERKDRKFEEINGQIREASMEKMKQDGHWNECMVQLFEVAKENIRTCQDLKASFELEHANAFEKQHTLLVDMQKQHTIYEEVVEQQRTEIHALGSQLTKEKGRLQSLLAEERRLRTEAEQGLKDFKAKAEQEYKIKSEDQEKVISSLRSHLSEVSHCRNDLERDCKIKIEEHETVISSLRLKLSEVPGYQEHLERQYKIKFEEQKKETEALSIYWQKKLDRERNQSEANLKHMLEELRQTSLPRPRQDEKTTQQEVMIAVMGSTGTGKSSLIQLLSCDEERIEIGQGPEPKTAQIRLSRPIECDGRRVTLVDIPSFDDFRKGTTDTDILKKLAAFLDVALQHGKKFVGILYLHRITDAKMGRTSSRNLRLFLKICGQSALKNVAVVTTHWDEIDQMEGEDRERRLSDDDYFKSFVDAGTKFFRHNKTHNSAHQVMKYLVNQEPITPILVKEVRELGSLDKTEAGIVLALLSQETREQLQAGTLWNDDEGRKYRGLKQKDAKMILEEIEREDQGLAEGLESVTIEQRHFIILSELQIAIRASADSLQTYKQFAHDLEEAVHEVEKAEFWAQRQQHSVRVESSINKPLRLFRQMHLLGARHQGHDSDYEPMIAVMGLTGTGKSSFIHLLTEDNSIQVGHSVESETTEITKHHYVQGDGRRVTLIDTPGFDDSRAGDGVTNAFLLRKLGDFLVNLNGRKLNGIIYLHRITDNKVGGTHGLIMHMFGKFCGPDALKNVVFVTTRWDGIKNEAEGLSREEQLKTSPKFLKCFIEGGARLTRHIGSFGSARRIVEELIKNEPVELQFQRELASGMRLEDTEAGSALRKDIRKLVQNHESDIRRLREEMQYAIAQNDARWRMELQAGKKEFGSG